MSFIECVCGEKVTLFTALTKEGKHHCGGCHKNFANKEWGHFGEIHTCPALSHSSDYKPMRFGRKKTRTAVVDKSIEEATSFIKVLLQPTTARALRQLGAAYEQKVTYFEKMAQLVEKLAPMEAALFVNQIVEFELHFHELMAEGIRNARKNNDVRPY